MYLFFYSEQAVIIFVIASIHRETPGIVIIISYLATLLVINKLLLFKKKKCLREIASYIFPYMVDKI